MARARDLSLRSAVRGDPALVVVAPNDPDAMARYAAECRDAAIPFLYDPSQQVARLTGEDLRAGLEGAFLVIVNDYEFGILRQKTELTREGLEALVPVLVVTHGAEGSTISVAGPEGREVHAVPAANLDRPAVDPTGVGDAYRAGLVRGIRIGAPWDVAGRIGSVAASIVLESLGPQPERYEPADVHRAVRAELRPGAAPRATLCRRRRGRDRSALEFSLSRKGSILEQSSRASRRLRPSRPVSVREASTQRV